MKKLGKLSLKHLSGKELQRPEMRFLAGGYGDGGYGDGSYDGGSYDGGAKKKHTICCLPTPPDGSCTSEFESDVCDGDLCGNGQNYSCR